MTISKLDSHVSRLIDIYHSTVDIYRRNSIPEPEHSARFLLSAATNIGYKMSTFYANSAKILNEKELKDFDDYSRKRLNRVPVQYIIGSWDFYGFTISTSPPVLIPRPETEELVDRIVSSKIFKNIPSPKILDIGVGSGAIGIALLSAFPTAICIGIDISPEAVVLARRNADEILKNNDPDRYNCTLESYKEFCSKNIHTASFDLIVSNPPYIPTKEMSTLDPEVSWYEDRNALHGGVDGMDIIKEILDDASQLLRPDGPREVWMEVSESHPECIMSAISTSHQDILSFCGKYEWYRDLSGRPRFIRFMRKCSS